MTRGGKRISIARPVVFFTRKQMLTGVKARPMRFTVVVSVVQHPGRESPGIGGVEATRQIRSRTPEVVVLVLTMFDDDATVFTAMQAGARGYLLKGAEQDDIVGAIRAVVAGQAIFGPGIAARVLEFFSTPPVREVEAFPELTARERDILALLADGRRTSAIAQTLFLSPKTVSNNLTSIFAKLEVSDRAAAIIRAREGGLGSAP